MQFIGIAGSILVFVSLVLPWWTASVTGMGLSASLNMYVYNTNFVTRDVQLGVAWTWLVLVLVTVSGLLGIAGSTGEREINEKLLISSGLLTLLSLLIFAAGVQFLVLGNLVMGAPFVLFSSSSYNDFSYLSYLSYGFWLAAGAAILLLYASTKA